MQESCSSFKRSIDSLLWQKKVDWNYFEGNNQGTDALQQISIYEQLIQGNEEKIKKSFLRHTPLKEIKQEIENQKAIIKQFQQNLRQNYLSLSYPQPDWYMPNIGWEVSRAECNIYDIFKRCFL